MAWIKRNLYFAITVVVALGVTGYCGYLLYSALSENVAASDQYASAKSGLDELQKKSPYPSPENIKAAEEDAARVRTFLAEFRKPFASFPAPPKMDDREFTEYLQKCVNQFGAAATNAGVGMQPDYAFSFSQQVGKLNHPAEYIAPWLEELEEIDAILHILYNAKINYLEKIKRPPGGPDDFGSDDYIQFNTNVTPWGVVSPYMVEFRAFSPEVANVLAGIAGSSNCLIIKAVYVSPSRVPLPQVTQTQPEQAPAVQYFRPPPPRDQPNPYNNPFGPNGGRGGREFREFSRPRPMPQQAAQAAAPATPAGPETILQETPLFVTIYIDVVQLKAAEPPPQEAKVERTARRPR
jgi:hypothetical protein